jgi:hypothetical protein
MSVIKGSQGLSSTIMNTQIVDNLIYSPTFGSYRFQVQVPTAQSNVSISIVQNGFGLGVAGPGNSAVGHVTDADYIIQGGILHFTDLVLLPEIKVLKDASKSKDTVLPALADVA